MRRKLTAGGGVGVRGVRKLILQPSSDISYAKFRLAGRY